MFTPELNAWEYGPRMGAARFTTAGAALNGALYVAGGFDGTQYLNSVERLDPRTPAWHLVRTRQRGFISKRNRKVCSSAKPLLRLC